MASLAVNLKHSQPFQPPHDVVSPLLVGTLRENYFDQRSGLRRKARPCRPFRMLTPVILMPLLVASLTGSKPYSLVNEPNTGGPPSSHSSSTPRSRTDATSCNVSAYFNG